MHRRCSLPATSSVHYTTSCNTQSSAPANGRNYRPKHVELIGIINKPLLLHLVGCLYYCISDAQSYKHQMSMEVWCNDKGGLKYLERSLSQYRVDHKFYIDWSGIEPVLCDEIRTWVTVWHLDFFDSHLLHWKLLRISFAGMTVHPSTITHNECKADKHVFLEQHQEPLPDC